MFAARIDALRCSGPIPIKRESARAMALSEERIDHANRAETLAVGQVFGI